jgi:hypothetical protein
VLAMKLNKSYEYCRRVVVGEVLPSRELNDAFCKFLGLDAETMWTQAEQERAYKRFGGLPGITAVVIPPPDPRLRRLWPRLSAEEIERICRYAEALVEVREAGSLVEQAQKRRRPKKEQGRRPVC